ncbi:unnamed protein product [Microthlaspi erraticum]|uniref:Integrase catalytic domain-containing protein n=1 Tax=Microthlaspi erraticum TaxID=1685480 RepID=A0A6D2HMK1_9BRAS|nr:unnamed protein product [Microthlaspi erraticum]
MAATSPASSGETIAVSENQQLVNVNMTNVTKLTSTNFLMWSRQVHALLDGYDLAGYVDGSVVVPPPTTTVGDVVSVNHAYTLWKRQDKLLYSALLGAISVSIQPLLSTANTTTEIWDILSSTYAKPSRGHIKQLKHQIKTWTKGVVVDQLEGRDTSPSLSEVHEKLLNHEAKLQSTTATTPSLPVSANVATYRGNNNTANYRGNNNRNQRSFHNNRNQQTWQQQQFQPRPDASTTRGYQGRCQLCGIQGHNARRCSQLPTGPFTSNYRAPPNVSPWQPRANMAAAAPMNSNNWLLDTGATHHLTSDLNNLSLHQLYNGGDEVTMADGSTIQISHTGFTSLPTPSRSLALNDVLCVPNVHKNLISVYRLYNSNQVSVEFFPAHFQVKDLRTGVRLLQRRTKDELYEWPVNPTNKASFFASPSPKASLPSWHSRLGHPSPPVLNKLVSQFSLPCSTSSKTLSPCSHCLINKSHKLPFFTNTIVSSQPLQYIYSDVWMSPIISTENFKYYLVLVDHHTRYTWMYPMKQKSQVRDIFIAFKALVENRFHTKIGTLFSDNGGEFLALRQFLSTHGISHLTSPPHTPEHNGI